MGTIEKMKSLTTDQNEIISSIQKLSPQQGDVLIFSIVTDEYGMPLMDINTVQQTADIVGEILEDRGVAGLFLMDKITVFPIDADVAIERLENCISYIREATNQAPDIENGELGEPIVVDMKDIAGDSFKRVL